MKRHPNVVGEGEIRRGEQFRGEGFGFRRKQLGKAGGGEKLGCGLYEAPPGRRAWPYRYHLANEEAVHVLGGSGTLRIGEEEVEVRERDYVALPVGKERAHQMTNSSDGALRYLCFSTMIEPGVFVYPNSNKVGLFAGAAPGGRKEERTLSLFLRADAEVGNWEGEG